MKHRFLLLILSTIATFFSLTIHAQSTGEKTKLPDWISDKGYWVVESNKKTPKEAVVYFYTNDHVLVHKEEVKNQKLKLNKKKTLRRFAAALDEALIAYENGNRVKNEFLLARHLSQ